MKYTLLTLFAIAAFSLSCSKETKSESTENTTKDSVVATTNQVSDSSSSVKIVDVELPKFKDESVNKFMQEYRDLTQQMEKEPTNEELQEKFMKLTNELSTIQSKMSTEEQKKWIEYSNKISE